MGKRKWRPSEQTRIDNKSALRNKAHRICVKLAGQYGSPDHGNKSDPLDEIVFIILSLMTTSPSYNRVYDRLRQACGTWESLLDMPLRRLRSVIKDGGLSNQKARSIRSILRQVKRDYGKLTLSALENMPDDEAESYLTGLPGVGTKTAKCVLMYSLGRNVLPVDTHVWRVAKRVGLVSPEVTYSGIHTALEAVVRPADRYSFHVNALAHGQQVCLATRPRCSECCLRTMCAYRRQQIRAPRLP